MRITFVAWRELAHPLAGGSEIVVDHLAHGLQDRGHHVELACGGPVSSRPYPVRSLGGTFDQYLRAPRRVRPVSADHLLVDVVNGMPYLSPLWWRGPRLALVHHIHEDQWQQYFPAPVAAAGRLVEEQALPRLYRGRPVVAISASTRDALAGLGASPEDLHVVPNGIDESLLAVEHPRAVEPTFVALGRLAPNKRLHLLLDVWQRVRPRVGGRLVLVGDGPEREALVARAVPGVELVGRIDEATKARLLGEAWLLVHTAPREGWGLVIMEAAAAGTPALAFDVAGVRDALVPGVTGELAADPDDLARRWLALAGDAARREALGRAARRRAADFTWKITVERFEDVCHRAVGCVSAGRGLGAKRVAA